MTAADEPTLGKPESGEQQLILEAKAETIAAFQSLVERHMKKTYNIAFSFVRNHDNAEDIAQEVFVKVHSALSSFRGEAEIGTWIYRITTNLSLNHLKQQKRKAERTMNVMDAGVTGLALHDNHAEESDRRGHIERALHELPTLQGRAVVILRHLDGLSTRQVSHVLKCSEGTVKTHLFRGLKKMRSKLLFLQESGA